LKAINDLNDNTATVISAFKTVGVNTQGCLGGDGNPGEAVLETGQAVTGLNGAEGSEVFYEMDVPADVTNLSFSTPGGSDDADLYVRARPSPGCR